MYIGHLVGAEIAKRIVPHAPTWVPLVGTSFPDLVWSVAVLFGIETVIVRQDSPLQKDVQFRNYPYSHSLILSGCIALIPSTVLALVYGWAVGGVFLLASVSHWLLDALVHLHDLPVFGFGKKDRKVGLALWAHPHAAFVVEYVLVVIATLLLLPHRLWLSTLIASLILHLGNANFFFGFTKQNPLKSSKQYALLTLIGFIFMIGIFVFLWR